MNTEFFTTNDIVEEIYAEEFVKEPKGREIIKDVTVAFIKHGKKEKLDKVLEEKKYQEIVDFIDRRNLQIDTLMKISGIADFKITERDSYVDSYIEKHGILPNKTSLKNHIYEVRKGTSGNKASYLQEHFPKEKGNLEKQLINRGYPVIPQKGYLSPMFTKTPDDKTLTGKGFNPNNYKSPRRACDVAISRVYRKIFGDLAINESRMKKDLNIKKSIIETSELYGICAYPKKIPCNGFMMRSTVEVITAQFLKFIGLSYEYEHKYTFLGRLITDFTIKTKSGKTAILETAFWQNGKGYHERLLEKENAFKVNSPSTKFIIFERNTSTMTLQELFEDLVKVLVEEKIIKKSSRLSFERFVASKLN